ncbi:MAG: NAD(P)H-hydrate dehydratase [Acidobacteria bacterium]|nr:NAD(P)H-hydrate dehydratase [Acidobacteriota bacterium]
MRVLDTAQMREADRRTIDEIGIPSIVLMENAGRAVAGAIEARFAAAARGRLALLCGRGSNGGDGLVAARALAERGAAVAIVLLARGEDVRGDARTNLDVARRLGLPVAEAPDEAAWQACRPDVAAADLVVDALVGTGLRAPLDGLPATVAADVNAARRPVVAVDLPSGLSADTGACIGASVDARVTVTLGAPKIPLVVTPAAERAGEMVVADIGIPSRVMDELGGPRVELLTGDVVRAWLPARGRDAHKGDHGRIVVVAGSPGKTGAARLAGTGALRSGAGLVTVATPASCVGPVATVPEYMTAALPETESGTARRTAVDVVLALGADVVAVGPGLGVGTEPRALVRALVERVPGPLVLDADALTALADDPGALALRRDRITVATPHPGEMARLAGTTVGEVQGNRLDAARRFAADHGVHVVLKGARTVIAAPSGSVRVNASGNPGMATGGTGDVLTGAVAAWLAQAADTEAAMSLAVHLHGRAGDLAADRVGETALVAGDVANHLGAAAVELAGH